LKAESYLGMGFIMCIDGKNMPGGVNNYANSVTQTGYDYCTDLPSTSGAIVSGEFNSPLLQKAEQEGYLALINDAVVLLTRVTGAGQTTPCRNSISSWDRDCGSELPPPNTLNAKIAQQVFEAVLTVFVALT
jgi:hypothetical protein